MSIDCLTFTKKLFLKIPFQHNKYNLQEIFTMRYFCRGKSITRILKNEWEINVFFKPSKLRSLNYCGKIVRMAKINQKSRSSRSQIEWNTFKIFYTKMNFCIKINYFQEHYWTNARATFRENMSNKSCWFGPRDQKLVYCN